MLKIPTAAISECYARALDARERADQAASPEVREFHLDLERRWLKLAQSYEMSDRVNSFLGMPPVIKHPVCAECGVAMWLVEIKNLPGRQARLEYCYECKVCESKASVEVEVKE